MRSSRAPLLALALVAACAEAPPPRTEPAEEPQGEPRFVGEVGVAVKDMDLRELMDEIGRRVGYNIIVEPGVHETVTLRLPRRPWRDVVREIASLYHCSIRDGGVWVLSQPPKIQVEVGKKSLGDLLDLVAGKLQNVVIAADVDRTAVPVCGEDGKTVPAEGFLEALAAQNGLHVTHVGWLRVVTKALAGDDVAPVVTYSMARVAAFAAPADGWFALVERATGDRVEHGAGPITLDCQASFRDLELATALASRVPWGRKDLRELPAPETLPSGRRVSLELQATWVGGGWGHELTLVNGRVHAVGDEVIPGVRVNAIQFDQIELRDGDAVYYLKPR